MKHVGSRAGLFLLICLFALGCKATMTETTLGPSPVLAPPSSAPDPTFPPANSVGKDYYIDAQGGSDAGSGLLPSQAWRTLSRANQQGSANGSARFQDGDRIVLKRGQLWRETLTLNSANIAPGARIGIVAYGPGAAPSITGSDPISGPWYDGRQLPQPISYAGVTVSQLVGQPVFFLQTPLPLQGLVVNGQHAPVARTPATGYKTLPAQATPSATQVVLSDPLLAQFGARAQTIRIRSTYWDREQKTITSYDTGSGTATLDTPEGYAITSGFGYVLMDTLPMLSAPGQWHLYVDSKFNSGAPANDALQILYYWSPTSAPPADGMIEGVTRNNAIAASFNGVLSLSGIDVRNTGAQAIDVAGASLNADSLSISNSGQEGVRVTSPGAGISATITNSTFSNSPNSGILTNTDLALISGNTFRNISFDMAEQNDWGYAIRASQASSVAISGNTILDAAGSGIITASVTGSVLITRNIIKRYCSLTNDCGAIYVNGEYMTAPNIEISYNEVTDALVDTSGTPSLTDYRSQAIYLDWCLSGAKVFGNAIVRSLGFAGIFVNGGHNNQIYGNNVFETYSAALDISKNDSSDTAAACTNSQGTGNLVHDNVFYTQGANVSDLVLEDTFHHPDGSLDTDLDFGTIGPNAFFDILTPSAELLKIPAPIGATQPGLQPAPVTLTAYQGLSTGNNGQVLYNDGVTPASFKLDQPMCDSANNLVPGPVTLQPGASLLLLACTCNFDGVCNNRETHATCPSDCP